MSESRGWDDVPVSTSLDAPKWPVHTELDGFGYALLADEFRVNR